MSFSVMGSHMLYCGVSRMHKTEKDKKRDKKAQEKDKKRDKKAQGHKKTKRT